MTYYPTRLTHTLLDIAKLGVCIDNSTEKFRGTRYDGTPDKEAYLAAYRIINGRPASHDETLVRWHYELKVLEYCFTKKGELNAFYKREVYTPKHILAKRDADAVKRMQENRDRKVFDKLKKKYGW